MSALYMYHLFLISNFAPWCNPSILLLYKSGVYTFFKRLEGGAVSLGRFHERRGPLWFDGSLLLEGGALWFDCSYKCAGDLRRSKEPCGILKFSTGVRQSMKHGNPVPYGDKKWSNLLVISLLALFYSFPQKNHCSIHASQRTWHVRRNTRSKGWNTGAIEEGRLSPQMI